MHFSTDRIPVISSNTQTVLQKVDPNSPNFLEVISKDSSVISSYLSSLRKKEEGFADQIIDLTKQKDLVAMAIERLENLQKGTVPFEIRDYEKLTPWCSKSLLELIQKGEIQLQEWVEPEEELELEVRETVRSNESNVNSRRPSTTSEIFTPEKLEPRLTARSFSELNNEPNEGDELREEKPVEVQKDKNDLTSVQVGAPYLSLSPHTDTIWALALHQKHNIFASASSDKTVKIHSFDIKRLDKEFQAVSEVFSVVFSKDINRFFYGCGNGIIYSYKDYKPEIQLKGHSKQVTMLDVDKNEFLLSGSSDNTMQLWNTAKKKSVFTFKHSDDVNGVSIGESSFCSGCQDGNTRIFDFKTNKMTGTITDTTAVTAVKFFDANMLATGLLNGKIKLYDIRQSLTKPSQEYEGHGGEIKSMALCSHFDREFISASVDGTLKTWNIAKNQGEMISLIGHQGAVRAVIANQMDIVSAGDDLTLKCWKLE
jgi:WD40 repeat protein